MPRSRLVAAALGALLLAGCGSTATPAPAERSARAGGPPASALSLPLSAAVPAEDVVPGGDSAGRAVAVRKAAGAAGPGGSARAAGGTGDTRGTVRLGFFVTDDASDVYKALGISGPSLSRDQSKALWGAIVAQVNARGGLGGRRIVPTFAFIDSESGSNATRAQAACEQFAVDEKVFAVVVDGAGDLSLPRCLAQHGVPVVDVGQTSYPYDDVDLRGLAPYLYLPGRLSMGRFATYVDTLAAQGFFAKDSTVALLRFDLPNQLRTRRDVVEPALARHGLRLAEDVVFTPVEGTADLPRAANEAGAAVLRMRSAGVDRVLFLGSGLALPYVFPTVAESQGYRPRYGITTDDGPSFMAENVPVEQLAGALAVGWEPQYDVVDSDAVLRHDAVWQQCARVMRAAGFTPRDGRRCTALYFLEEALRGEHALTPAALRAGADRIGARPYSTQTYRTRFRPGRYDGVAAVRALRFEATCTCFRYRTGDLATP